MSDREGSSRSSPQRGEQQSEPASLNESVIDDSEEDDEAAVNAGAGPVRLWLSDDEALAAAGGSGEGEWREVDGSAAGMEIDSTGTAAQAEVTPTGSNRSAMYEGDGAEPMQGVESSPLDEKRETEGAGEEEPRSSLAAITPPTTRNEPDQTSVNADGIDRLQQTQSNQPDQPVRLAPVQSNTVEDQQPATPEQSTPGLEIPASSVEIRVTSSPTPTPPLQAPPLPFTPTTGAATPMAQQHLQSSIKRLNLKGTPALMGANNKPLRLKRPDEAIHLEDHIAVRYTFPTLPHIGAVGHEGVGASEEEAGAPATTTAVGSADDIHLAVVKHIRDSAGSTSTDGGGDAADRLYYVHFAGEDRRLDVWLPKSAIVDVEKEGFTLAPSISASSVKKFTRRERRFNEEWQNAPKSFEEHDATTAKLEKEHEERTKVKNVEKIYYGGYDITTWYFSPFLPELIQGAKKLYFCEHCLLYTKDLEVFICHKKDYCKVRRPPGREIYREGNVAVFEVVGRENKTYCQSLCLLSKLFLDHKTLYYDVDLFLFYVLCEMGDGGAGPHSALTSSGLLPVGHFSKELRSENNLACIMVLPPFGRNGYGKLLIQLSYHLSDLECRIGTPEKPLSDLGKACYRDYWLYVLLETLDWSWTEGLRKPDDHITMAELSEMTGIHAADVLYAFNTLQLVKYWKGSSLARLENGDHVVRVSRQFVQDCRRNKLCHPPKLMLKKDLVHWQPSMH